MTNFWSLFNVAVCVFLIGINWLALKLLHRLFPVFSSIWVRVAYWGLACLANSGYVLLRSAAFRSVTADDLRLQGLLYLTVIWNVGLGLFVLTFPLCYSIYRVQRRNSATVKDESGIMTRREFLGKTLAVMPVGSFTAATAGLVMAQTDLVVVRRTLAVTGLPEYLSGMKIAQVSDAHLGLFFSLARWDETLRLVEAEAPDLLLVTGDLVDDLALLAGALEKLAALGPLLPCGIYACLGNHEYFRDINVVRQSFAAAGIPLLINENRQIARNGGHFYLAGVDYPLTRNPKERQAACRLYANKALGGIPAQTFRIMMAHHPDFIIEGFERKIPLTLAGHTHGVQVGWGERSLFESAFSYTRGLYRQGGLYGYVSSGVGHWLPFRVACPPEIAVLTLARQDGD